MAPSAKKRKSVSVTYIPDRSKAVNMGKRITLKKRQTTIRPITFEISVVENDSPTPVSKPDLPTNDKREPSVADVRMENQNVEAGSPSVHSTGQAEGSKRNNIDRTQASSGNQSSTANVGRQSSSTVNAGHQSSSTVNVEHQPIIASAVKAGHQSSINRSAQHKSQTTRAGHKSVTFEAGLQSLSVKSGSRSIGHKILVHQTTEDRSSTIEATSQSPPVGSGHQSRALEAVSQSTAVDSGHQSRALEAETQSTAMGSGHQSTGLEAETQSARHQTTELDSVPENRTQRNDPLPRDEDVASSRGLSDDNLSDIFRVPLPVKRSIYSRPISTVHTPCDTPMRPPSITSTPLASTSQSFDLVPANGRPSGVHLGPNYDTTMGNIPAQQRHREPPPANDQPLEDMVIRVKQDSSDEDGATVRPTVSNLSDLTVLVSAMEDVFGQFISETQPSAEIKKFLSDVTDAAFARLRRTSQASHSIGKLNRRLRASRNELSRKRKELIRLQQEHNRLEVEVATAKKRLTISSSAVDDASREKINNYLLRLRRLA